VTGDQDAHVSTGKLDTAYSIETPEGVSLELHPAGPVSRGGAWIVDALIRGLLYTLLFFVLALTGATGIGILLVLFFLLEWFYPVYFEIAKGATPGKAAFGMQVVHSNGTPVAWQASMIRNLLRAVDFLPFMYGFGLTSMLLNSRFQRLGDLAAGTLVIYAPKRRPFLALADSDPEQPPAGLTRKQQQAIIGFSERLDRLSDSRKQELASHLSPITGATGERGVRKLLAYARWYARGGN
jgi:uncharacterized RDD family membrane protein YckC